MSILTKQNNDAVLADTPLIFDASSKEQEITANHQELQIIPSPEQFRIKKVLAVQKQLIEGTYDIEERLKVAIDRLLDNLVA